MAGWSGIKALRSTFMAAGVVTLLLSQRHCGFMLFLVLLFLLPWLLASLWICIRDPQQRSLRASQAAIWLLSISLIVCVHVYIATQTHSNAQRLVERVIAYQQRYGHYPANVQAIGYSDAQIHDMLGMGDYQLTEGQPYLFYATTYLPFETESYDFSLHQWQHRG